MNGDRYKNNPALYIKMPTSRTAKYLQTELALSKIAAQKTARQMDWLEKDIAKGGSSASVRVSGIPEAAREVLEFVVDRRPPSSVVLRGRGQIKETVKGIWIAFAEGGPTLIFDYDRDQFFLSSFVDWVRLR